MILLGSGSVVMLVFVPPAESSVSMILFILSTVVCVFISCFTLIHFSHVSCFDFLLLTGYSPVCSPVSAK